MADDPSCSRDDHHHGGDGASPMQVDQQQPDELAVLLSSSVATAPTRVKRKKPQDADFLNDLTEPLASIVQSVLLPPIANDEGSLSEDATNNVVPDALVRADQLEVRLRREMFARIRNSSTERQDSTTGSALSCCLEDIGSFWIACSEVCLHLVHFADDQKHPRYNGMAVRKLPFVLLEDILDSLSTDLCMSFWNVYVEPAAAVAADDLLFTPIMWQPSLVSKQQQQQQQPPCWLPFLRVCNKLLRRLPPGVAAARIMRKLAHVYPLSDKMANKVWGSRNSDNVTQLESLQEFEEQQQQQHQHSDLHPTTSPVTSHNHGRKSNEEEEEEGALGDYNFYESFWSLQRDFSAPYITNLASFLQRLRQLILAVDTQTTTQQIDGNASATTNSATGSSSSFVSAKYLTSSRLLTIQLADPDFRIHVLTQFLIVAHHLASEAPTVGNQLVDLQTRARAVLVKIPKGDRHLKVVDHILQTSEVHWRRWKKNKCQPDLDQKSGTAAPAGDSNNKLSRKRKLGALGMSPRRDEEKAAMEHEYALFDLDKDVPVFAETLWKMKPSVDQHLDDYVEALDPESGIEAEYHPKTNRYFSWQALRLLSTEHLADLDSMHPNGDFESMVRTIYQRDKSVTIPGEAPAYQEVDQEEEKAESPIADRVDEMVDPMQVEPTSTNRSVETSEQDGDDDAARGPSRSRSVESVEMINSSRSSPSPLPSPRESTTEKVDNNHGRENKKADSNGMILSPANVNVKSVSREEPRNARSPPPTTRSPPRNAPPTSRTAENTRARNEPPREPPARGGGGEGGRLSTTAFNRGDQEHGPPPPSRLHESGHHATGSSRAPPPQQRPREDERRGGGGGRAEVPPPRVNDRRGERWEESSARRGGDDRRVVVDDRRGEDRSRDRDRDSRRGGGGGRRSYSSRR